MSSCFKVEVFIEKNFLFVIIITIYPPYLRESVDGAIIKVASSDYPDLLLETSRMLLSD